MDNQETKNKLLSMRVNFVSLEQMVDDYLPAFVRHFGLEGKSVDKMREGLKTMLEMFLFEVQHAVKKGAEKGIEEALNLVGDAKYYENVKKRRQREIDRRKANTAAQKEKAEAPPPKRTKSTNLNEQARLLNNIGIYKKRLQEAEERYQFLQREITTLPGSILEDEDSEIIKNENDSFDDFNFFDMNSVLEEED